MNARQNIPKRMKTAGKKKVSETYLLDAVSFTEAETRIYKELVSMVSGEFSVTRISRTKLAEIIPSESGDRWYKAKVTFITFDEGERERETGKPVYAGFFR